MDKFYNIIMVMCLIFMVITVIDNLSLHPGVVVRGTYFMVNAILLCLLLLSQYLNDGDKKRRSVYAGLALFLFLLTLWIIFAVFTHKGSHFLYMNNSVIWGGISAAVIILILAISISKKIKI